MGARPGRQLPVVGQLELCHQVAVRVEGSGEDGESVVRSTFVPANLKKKGDDSAWTR